jgi:hypothetical protein
MRADAGSPAAQARAEARHILSERRYHGSSVPRPFHGILDWLGRHLHFVANAWDWIARHVGGQHVLWGIVGAICVAVAAWAASRLARRRAGREASAAAAAAGARRDDPRELERLADEAERRGDLEIALRLRFRAGLLRLGREQALTWRPSLRTREARRALRSARFDRLAREFDEVVYGRRPARSDDLASARSEWPHVLEEARR